MRFMARVNALGEFISSEDGSNLLTAYKRAANILRIEEKKDGVSYTEAPDSAIFAKAKENALHNAITNVNGRTAKALKTESYRDAMAIMAALRRPVDAFFDHVTVNAEDAKLRKNRLNLLSEIRDSLDRIADFSKIEG